MDWVPSPTGGSGVLLRKADVDVGTRPTINLHEGAGISLTVADDSANDEVDVTIAASGGGGGVVDHAQAARTAANVGISATSWTAVDTATDLSLAASAGDLIVVNLSTAWFRSPSGGQSGMMVAATMVSGSPVNYINGVSGGAEGVTGWRMTSSPTDVMIGPSVQYVVQAGDVDAGAISLRLLAKVNTSSLVIVSNANYPLQFSAVNLGQ